MSEYYCPNCDADLEEQSGFNPSLESWICTECGQLLIDPEKDYQTDRFDDVIWFCDECGALLNAQSGFSDWHDTWTCTECGHTNNISEDEIFSSQEEYNMSKIEEEQENYQSGIDEEDEEDEDEEDEDEEDEDEEDEDEEDEDEEDEYEEDEEEEDEEEEDEKEEDEKEEDEKEEDEEDKDNKSKKVTHNTLKSKATKTNNKIIKTKNKITRTIKKVLFRLMIIMMVVAMATAVGAIGYYYYLHEEGIEIGFSSDDVAGFDYPKVYRLLKDKGFKNVNVINVNDLNYEEIEKENTVLWVEIKGYDFFEMTDRIPYDAEIVIVYHSLKNINIPLSSEDLKSKDYKKKSYLEIVELFEKEGFVNVKTEPIKDLTKGWLTKDGSVEEVIVNGSSEFEKGDSLRPDVEVIIKYHTFKEKKK